MKKTDTIFLKNVFKKYYFEHSSMLKTPKRASEREFGYQIFKVNVNMIRHLSIKNDQELHLLCIQNIPTDIYCSNSCYLFPNLAMTEKDWKDADLIFDIDAKDLNLSCRANHTVSICSECNNASKISKQCQECNSTRLETKSLPCKNCINAAKTEVEKLNDILINDLNITTEKIKVYFSGNEGFHVHVDDSQYNQCNSKERSDLVDYMLFNGVIPKTMGMTNLPQKINFPNLDDRGWRGRFAKEAFGSKTRRTKEITRIINSPNNKEIFQDLLTSVSKRIKVNIDPNVTTDIHRIFRLPGSINSKSGLVKIECNDLSKFEPFREAIFIGAEPVDVFANCPIEFRLNNKKFGPYAKEKITIPTFAAVYMICKKLATTN